MKQTGVLKNVPAVMDRYFDSARDEIKRTGYKRNKQPYILFPGKRISGQQKD